jgi:mannose/fructose/N-acetylgalactosamine-specific phosphotransferase system component IID
MALKRSEARRLAVRSLFLQVLLNYHTMQGGGYLFALWPWLRQTDPSGKRALASASYLNAHPVLAALAIGAMRRRIEDGDVEKDPEAFAEWQTALCGPLGVVGDTLIWDRWKPLLFSLVVLVMICFPTLTVWIITAAACLLLYNVPLYYLRLWGVREGYKLGTDVLTIVNYPAFARARKVLTIIGAFVTGALFAAGFMRSVSETLITGGQFLLAFSITLLGVRRRWSIAWTLLVALLAVFILPQFIR